MKLTYESEVNELLRFLAQRARNYHIEYTTSKRNTLIIFGKKQVYWLTEMMSIMRTLNHRLSKNRYDLDAYVTANYFRFMLCNFD